MQGTWTRSKPGRNAASNFLFGCLRILTTQLRALHRDTAVEKKERRPKFDRHGAGVIRLPGLASGVGRGIADTRHFYPRVHRYCTSILLCIVFGLARPVGRAPRSRTTRRNGGLPATDRVATDRGGDRAPLRTSRDSRPRLLDLVARQAAAFRPGKDSADAVGVLWAVSVASAAARCTGG